VKSPTAATIEIAAIASTPGMVINRATSGSMRASTASSLSTMACSPPWKSNCRRARIRRAVRARGHFPNEQAALKCVHLGVMSLDTTGKGRKRWITHWKAALDAFEIAFEGRLSVGRK
jgi:hypothetical protein